MTDITNFPEVACVFDHTLQHGVDDITELESSRLLHYCEAVKYVRFPSKSIRRVLLGHSKNVLSVRFPFAPLLSCTTLHISHRPILTTSNNGRSSDGVIRISKVQTLKAGRERNLIYFVDIPRAFFANSSLQSGIGILPRIKTKTDEGITPWTILEYITHEGKKSF